MLMHRVPVAPRLFVEMSHFLLCELPEVAAANDLSISVF